MDSVPTGPTGPNRRHALRFALPLLLATGVAAPVASQGGNPVFVRNTSDIPVGFPQSEVPTENVDFGDIDNDGDFDAGFAVGGSFGSLQNRLWVNQGFEQNGIQGVFIDRTVAQFPNVLDDSRDIEFVDIDDDDDLDVYISNTSQRTMQPNRWWVNVGGAQGGVIGNYVDETSFRWVGIGGPGSSVAPSQVLPAGGFIDWSCDCDFGDLDNDGDMDLVHSTYGQGFNGLAPTRIFLNDGDGFFQEFNPTGFQTMNVNLPAGSPAIWAQGTYQPNTTNTTGQEADIALAAVDIDLADVDLDLDLDIIHGDRDENPRLFKNTLSETGVLGFRDVSQEAFGSVGDWATTGNYEQEMGDVDRDGDVDLLGVNWSGFTDIVRLNDGHGVFGDEILLPNSAADDHEGDFLDFDNDGDLDIFMTNFSGPNRLYRNESNMDFSPGSMRFTLVPNSGASGGTSRDADAADVDGDGDLDVFVVNDIFQPNEFLENVTQVPDMVPPYIPVIETLSSPLTAGDEPVVIRAAVYDNAPYYQIWYYRAWMEITVDGEPIENVEMEISGNEIFRGEMPGNLVGTVCYLIRTIDHCGNEGSSVPAYFDSVETTASSATYGTGQSAGLVPEPSIGALSAAFGGTTLYISGRDLPGGSVGILSLGLFAEDPPLVIPALGTINVNTVVFNAVTVTASSDPVLFGLAIPDDVPIGAHLYFQYFGLNGGAGPLLASSVGLDVETL